MIKAGFIGMGNMGSALARAVAKSEEAELILSNHSPAKVRKLSEELYAETGNNKEVAAGAEYIFLCVKPGQMAEVMKEIRYVLAKNRDRFVLVTIAAGMSMDRILEMAGDSYPIIRIMPNTPVAIGKGEILYTRNDLVSDEDLKNFLKIMKKAGRLTAIPEKLMDAGSAVSGCGPAFCYMFIDALADGGVACGLSRQDALILASQMVMGSASMILETGVHPGVLKDAVCSPGGTTIEGVKALEDGGFRSSVINAVTKAYEKSAKL